ncbi:metallophosphoesterase [Orrella sp. 11846]|uniref:metallophosphoesterase n=1 Tax=Orrella sp. 11846 TaxID=3409913 RepID=UPI003B5AC5D3
MSTPPESDNPSSSKKPLADHALMAKGTGAWLHIIRFLQTILLVLLVGHLYTLWRLWSVAGSTLGHISLAVFLLIVYVLIIGGFIARLTKETAWTRAISWAGYLLLGFFSWLFVLTVIRDGTLMALWATAMLRGEILFYYTPFLWLDDYRFWSAVAVLTISVLATGLGLINVSRRPAVVRVQVPIDNLPQAFAGYTFAQITDLHVGPTIREGFVTKVVELTNSLKADSIVLTGDLVDGTVAALQSHTALLGDLKAQDGVYVITGNHEYYSGAGSWIQEYERLGLHVLQNTHVTITRQEDIMILAGVNDPVSERFDPQHACDPEAALQNTPDDAAVRVLLAHQPRTMTQAQPLGFDLQLSGHTHGGQFWPWMYFVPIEQPLVSGLHRYKNMWVYVSCGTGYWGPPMRLGAPAEITLITLVPA